MPLRVLLLTLLLIAATGCGQTGPLYLPEDAPQGETED